MTPRERIRAVLDFKQTDRLPKDLGGMRSSGISAFAYPALVEALGLQPRPTRIMDTGQMLAFPDLDVLDALECDVVTIDNGVSNISTDLKGWQPYGFNGRLKALVRHPEAFRTDENETIHQWEDSRMPPSSYVFDSEHAGCPLLDSDASLPLIDLDRYRSQMANWVFTDDVIRKAIDVCKQTRDMTDRAILYTEHFGARIAISGHGGIGVFPIICLLEPSYVQEYHDITVNAVIRNMRLLLPEIAPYIDVIITGGDDWGTQNAPMAPPQVYKNLFLPYYKIVNDEAHRLAPDIKTFLHSCGAIYELLDMMVESGFDIINPIQWPAGGHSYKEWKDKLRNRATLWGGAVNSQDTLVFGSIEKIEEEATNVSTYLAQDGGYVFNCIHNFLAETAPDKIIALYRVADRIIPFTRT